LISITVDHGNSLSAGGPLVVIACMASKCWYVGHMIPFCSGVHGVLGKCMDAVFEIICSEQSAIWTNLIT